MMEESSVRRLKRHLPEEVYPKHFRVYGSVLNEEAGFDLLPNISDGRRVKVYILDESQKKKPYGAWGPLYVMDCEPSVFNEVIENPYGPGTLYATGLKARILSDGTVDFLEKAGREVVTDGVHGRRFFDLNKVEENLLDCDGIQTAQAYMKYNPAENELTLYADITAEDGFDKDACLENLKQNSIPELVPVELLDA